MNRPWIVLLLLVSLLGCSEPAKTTACAPGATQACACAGGAQGAQSCAGDGSRWETCACAAASPSGSPSSAPTAAADAVPDGPQPYTLTVVSANIAPSKANGDGWDAGDGPPDPVATVLVAGAGSGRVHTSKAENATAPTWDQSARVTLNKGDKLEATLVDKDVASDDPIGRAEMTFTKPGRFTLKGGSINALVVTIAPASK